MRQIIHEKIQDVVSGEIVFDTSEERCVQFLAKWLLSIGYKKEQLQVHPQFKIKRNGKIWPVDIAIFQCSRRDTTPIAIAECKKEKSGTTRGADQLTGYLDQSGAKLGIWFDGERMSYIIRIQEAVKCMEMAGSLLPPKDSEFGLYLRTKREKLQEKDPSYSLRKVASRVGVSPSYLSKVENGVSAASNELLVNLSKEFGEEENELFQKAGRIPEELMDSMSASVIAHPKAWKEILELIKEIPSENLSLVLEKLNEKLIKARKVRDGEW